MTLYIKEAREKAGFSQKELADMIGVAPNTFHGYESGKHDPKSDLLSKIAQACGVSVDYLLGVEKQNSPVLSDEAQRLARDYDELDDYGQRAVRAVADVELDRIRKPASNVIGVEEARKKVIPLLGGSFAAGRAEPDFGNAWTDYEIDADSPAEFAIHIHGDSMEPYLHDGSIALGVKREPQDGDVGAFMLGGEFLVKQYCEDILGNVYLFSLNRARSDADVTLWAKDRDNNELVCFGTILMKKRVPLPM